MQVSSRLVGLVNSSRGTGLAQKARIADSFASRLAGLLIGPPLKQGEGLWLVPANGVHTMGMRYPIDILFLDRKHIVVACHPSLAPWRTAIPVAGAFSCLELPAGTIAGTGTACGDQLRLEPVCADGACGVPAAACRPEQDYGR
ncbi:MAG: DUF192 domain-containing protein [Bacillota bacterium]|nr:DUF192 domain-containing protein [Bacillota bacterium]